MSQMTPDEARAFAERLLTPTVQAGETVTFRLVTGSPLPARPLARGDRVTVHGTIWQDPKCGTLIIEADGCPPGEGLFAIPAQCARPEAEA